MTAVDAKMAPYQVCLSSLSSAFCWNHSPIIAQLRLVSGYGCTARPRGRLSRSELTDETAASLLKMDLSRCSLYTQNSLCWPESDDMIPAKWPLYIRRLLSDCFWGGLYSTGKFKAPQYSSFFLTFFGMGSFWRTIHERLAMYTCVGACSYVWVYKIKVENNVFS